MAGKNSFDPKEFLVQHGEKVALGLVVPIALFIMATGFFYSPPNWTPDDLEKIASNTTSFLDRVERSAADEEVVVFAYDNFAHMIKKGVSAASYPTPTLWRPSLFPEKQRRGGVEILSVRNLRATQGMGAIAINANRAGQSGGGGGSGMSGGSGGAGGEKEGKQWAVITGLIPIKEQYNIYLAAFANATHTDPNRDFPLYSFYQIERCEVNPAGNGTWQPLNPLDALMKTEVPRWQSAAPEVVDPTFMVSRQILPMAFPLPPVVSRSFGKEVAHIPEIPLLSESMAETQKTDVDALKKLEAQQQSLVNMNTLLNFNAYGASSTTSPLVSDIDKEKEATHVDYYLFRYFDFSVQTGKTYRYRVKLMMSNPNSGLIDTQVEDTNSTMSPQLFSEWSDSSNAVIIGSDSRILLTSVTAPKSRTFYDDPTATITAIYFDLKEGSDWYSAPRTVRRGSVADFRNEDVTGVGVTKSSSASPDSSSRGPTPRGGSSRTSGSGGTAPEQTTKKVNVVSGVCILDIMGGNEFPTTKNGNKDLRSPGQMLVVSPTGTMEIRSLNEDRAETEQLKGMTSSRSMGGRDGPGGGPGGPPGAPSGRGAPPR